MHQNAKKRISEKKKTTDKRPVFSLPKNSGYIEFISGVERLAEKMIKDQTIAKEDREKIAKSIQKLKIYL